VLYRRGEPKLRLLLGLLKLSQDIISGAFDCLDILTTSMPFASNSSLICDPTNPLAPEMTILLLLLTATIRLKTLVSLHTELPPLPLCMTFV
jgi:hypothetical protein